MATDDALTTEERVHISKVQQRIATTSFALEVMRVELQDTLRRIFAAHDINPMTDTVDLGTGKITRSASKEPANDPR